MVVVNAATGLSMILFVFGCAGSSMLCRLFSSRSEWGLDSHLSVRASRVVASLVELGL